MLRLTLLSSSSTVSLTTTGAAETAFLFFCIIKKARAEPSTIVAAPAAPRMIVSLMSASLIVRWMDYDRLDAISLGVRYMFCVCNR